MGVSKWVFGCSAEPKERAGTDAKTRNLGFGVKGLAFPWGSSLETIAYIESLSLNPTELYTWYLHGAICSLRDWGQGGEA